MPAMPSGIPACPDSSRRHRLAVQLADMIPGAATIRVSLTDPTHAWPQPHTVVQDEAGKTMELGRTASKVAARWIMRVWPDEDWNRPRTFRLADATLTRSDLIAAEWGR
ncbi:transcriptional regulator [Streptomyces sp. NPDC058576]|uniref:transcriptional regulator n=1 Tax=Streptomyces sp. NPDC058576 TaxID=3346547 RepID=UPI003660FFE1